jgi:hypothetical protein
MRGEGRGRLTSNRGVQGRPANPLETRLAGFRTIQHRALELRDIAIRERADLLRYLLEMVAIEAEEQMEAARAADMQYERDDS